MLSNTVGISLGNHLFTFPLQTIGILVGSSIWQERFVSRDSVNGPERKWFRPNPTEHRRRFASKAPTLLGFQNGQMWGISRQETTQQMILSGMPTLRKSVNL